MQICLMQIFPKLKNSKKRVSSKAISTHCVLCRHNTPFASTPHYRKLFSRADAAATALQLYILSSHHAQEILPRKLEYYLPVPCQIRHIDFDACYSLCSSLFALCRNDSCWVMEFKVWCTLAQEILPRKLEFYLSPCTMPNTSY